MGIIDILALRWEITTFSLINLSLCSLVYKLAQSNAYKNLSSKKTRCGFVRSSDGDTSPYKAQSHWTKVYFDVL